MDELEKEFEKMDKALAGELDDIDEDEQAVEEPVTVEVPPTESPPIEEPISPVEEEEPVAEKPRTGEDILRDTVARLESEVAELKRPKKVEPVIEEPSVEVPINDEDFVGEIDLDELTRDSGQLNKVLNAMYKKAVETARSDIRKGNETILRSVPDIVKTSAVTIKALEKASEGFYNDNKDLQPFKKVVAAVFEELASENPDKTYTEILSGVGDETRKRLDLHKKAVVNERESPPPLPRKKGSMERSQTKPDTNPMLGELAEMDRVMGYEGR